MEIFLLILVMIGVGVLIGALAGPIWKGWRPLGLAGDLLIAILCTVIIGLIDWTIIPAMNFSDTVKYLGVALEPALGALLALWLVRRARS